jgi:hypothetical protein
MTLSPKQKANELISLHSLTILSEVGNYLTMDEVKQLAKQCALIAVNEILLSSPFEPVDTDWDEAGGSALYWYPQKLKDSAKWWSEVKQEIEKL